MSYVISEEGPQIEQPQQITQVLKVHQKRLVYEMIQKETNFSRDMPGINLGFVADKVGSGKSISILSLLASNSEIQYDENMSNMSNSKTHEQDELLIGFTFEKNNYINTNLVIVPHNIYHQWVQYIQNNTILSCLCIQGKSDINQWMNSSNPLKMLSHVDLILVKSTKANEFLKQVAVYMNIVDTKAEFIKNQKYEDTIHELFKVNIRTYFNDKSNNIVRYLQQVYEVFNLIQQLNIQSLCHQRDILRKLTNELHYMSNIYYDSQQLEQVQMMIFQLNPIDQNIICQLKKILRNISLNTLNDIYQSLLPILSKTQLSDLIKNIQPNENYVGIVRKWNGPTFKRIIIDEIDSIKIPQSVPMFGKFNWYITSSVQTLIDQYRRIESSGFLREVLYSMQKYIIRNTLKNSDILVDLSFRLEEPLIKSILCTADKNIQILSNFTSSGVLNALNADDVITASQLLGFDQIGDKDLPSLFIAQIETQIIQKQQKIANKRIQMIELQQIIDQEQDKENYNKENVDKLKKQKYDIQYQLKKKQMSLEALNIKKQQVQDRIKSVLQVECPICMETQKNPTILPCCKISICFKCIAKMQQSKGGQSRQIKCPVCRQSCDSSTLFLVVKKEINEQKSKLETLVHLIQQKPSGKFLVFSEFEHGFMKMKEILDQNNIKFSRICGTSSKVQQILLDFQQGKTQVLLLDAKFFGSGLNLQFATDIICYHNMGSDLKQQVIGRGQRIGRTERLTVTFLYNSTEQAQQ